MLNSLGILKSLNVELTQFWELTQTLQLQNGNSVRIGISFKRWNSLNFFLTHTEEGTHSKLTTTNWEFPQDWELNRNWEHGLIWELPQIWDLRIGN